MLKKAVCLVSGLNALTACAQEHLLVSIDEVSLGTWTITAELLNPNPNKVILAVVGQFMFSMEGYGFDGLVYNEQFDSVFAGPTSIFVTNTYVEFWGNQWLPPLNNPDGPDSSNPFWVLSFDADSVDHFEFLENATGAYVGSSLPEVFTYYRQDVEINPIPGTSAIGSFCSAGIFLSARRRR